ncbi:stage IV sporulation protein A [Anaerocolumna cellulosilytica]|uniref:Stage IV sporulation protein A n=1 Tax=Anaerocolumna cellulosilytica TaxID=433286 RepID=A0A6S6QUY6_9FIRM|nr:stage IV sporulation protein A [Anaerocolumna cellulosilytica]MBB5198055.1 stage IV sporulation protein A [Anaerocolumna cellulosilytica]BCJ95073.1 stage IV sporulation protein A [Anaerocolumna cellulosilytica]
MLEQFSSLDLSNQIYDVYNDIKARTGGDIYIGVVGPVRTGKSTFIKRFMDLLVIPNIQDVHNKERAIDELPQSAAGKTIMTTEPKFIPKEAAQVKLGEDTTVNIRLIDCVGYMVDGASGHIENEQERLVKTPWYDYEIPFTQAAEIGTQKVINEHSTIGVVITTDGSFGELPRDNYIPAEEKTIGELKRLRKPFIVLLNTNKPYSETTLNLANDIAGKYNVTVMPVNCEQLKKEDINRIMSNILSVFPVSEINFFMPKWAEMLSDDHWLKQDLLASINQLLKKVSLIRDARPENLITDSQYVDRFKIDKIEMENGTIKVDIEFDETYYYTILSDLIGVPIADEYQLISTIRELADMKYEYQKVGGACSDVRNRGYGVVTPTREEITVEEPEIMKHGNKYGVKIRATAPSIHMIKANIETEIAPIVGSEEQANDLINYIKKNSSENPDGIWETNIYGKSIQQLVDDGISAKISKMTDESQLKLQDTMQKIINDSNGGIICIII